jgi:hypothetical protein
VLASMQPKIDDLVATALDNHLKPLDLQSPIHSSIVVQSPLNLTVNLIVVQNPLTLPKICEETGVLLYGWNDLPKSMQIAHINNSGPPAHFDGSHLFYWKSSMESHLRSCSEEFWQRLFEALLVSGMIVNSITSRKKDFHLHPLVPKQFGPRLIWALVPVQMQMWARKH